MKYEFYFYRTQHGTVSVEAETEAEAREIAENGGGEEHTTEGGVEILELVDRKTTTV